jgi:hypothetical protein
MGYINEIAKLIGSITAITGALVAAYKVYGEWMKAKAGQLCLLRNELLKIYYKYKDTEELPQYEAQNFIMMYEAYKARGGNSFIDEVHDHVIKWELSKGGHNYD